MKILQFSGYLSILLLNQFKHLDAEEQTYNQRIKKRQLRIGHPDKKETPKKQHDRFLSYDNFLFNSTSSIDESNNYTNAIQKIDTYDSYIVGGTKVLSSSTYPYLVSIMEVDIWTNKAIHQCAGTLITPNIVLTAAHCVEYSAMRIVDVGRFNWYGNENVVESYRIDKIYTHPEFNGNFFINDVALIKLNREVSGMSKYATLVQDYDTMHVDIDDSVSIIGWGLTSDNGIPSLNLLQADLSVISKMECQKTYGKFINDAMFCAYGDGKDACQGDSGGPAFKINDEGIYQVGIISWGEKCGVHPGVYTNLETPIIMNFINSFICDKLSPQSCTNGIFYGMQNNNTQEEIPNGQIETLQNKCSNTNDADCDFVSIIPILGCTMAYEECPEICCPDSCNPDQGCIF